jgi:hypothetical protein
VPAQFEVASVKANTSGDARVVIQILPGATSIDTISTPSTAHEQA